MRRTGPARPGPMVAALLGLLGLLALSVAGCELRLALDIDVERRGGGVVALSVELEPELVAELESSGLEPFAGLEDLRERTTGWDVRGTRTDDGRVVLRAAADFERPEQLAELVDGLHRALDDEDVRLAESLRLVERAGGGWELRGAAGLLLPSEAGARGIGVDFTGEDLETLLEERDDLVDYRLRVRFPGEASSPDADHLEDGTVSWHLPVGSVHQIAAEAEPVFPLGPLEILAGAAVLLAVLVLLAWWRRRR